VTADSGASSFVPETTDSPLLVPDVNHTPVDAPVSIEDHFSASDLLDAVRGDHTDSDSFTSSTPHAIYPLPSVPDANHMSVDALTSIDTVEDYFRVSDLSDITEGGYSIDQGFPLDEPWDHFLSGGGGHDGGGSHVDNFNIDLDSEFLHRYLIHLLNTYI
jgi:hypothetical protein